MSDFESEDEIDPIAMLRRPAYLKKPHVVSLADKQQPKDETNYFEGETWSKLPEIDESIVAIDILSQSTEQINKMHPKTLELCLKMHFSQQKQSQKTKEDLAQILEIFEAVDVAAKTIFLSYIKIDLNLQLTNPQLVRELVDKLNESISLQFKKVEDFETKLQLLQTYTKLREKQARLDDFYLTEIFKSKHPFMLTKQGSWVNSWFLKHASSQQKSQVVEYMLEDPAFYMRCKPYFREFVKITQKNIVVPESKRIEITELFLKYIQEVCTDQERVFDLRYDPTMVDYVAMNLILAKFQNEHIVEFLRKSLPRLMRLFNNHVPAMITYLTAAKIRHPTQTEAINTDLHLMVVKLQDNIKKLKEYDQGMASSGLFKEALALYKIRIDLGPASLLEEEKADLIQTLDNLLSYESCPKLLYLHLIRYVMDAQVMVDQISDTFAAYYEKFQFRYGFQDDEIMILNQFFKQYQYRRSAKQVIEKVTNQFNDMVSNEQFKPKLKQKITQILRIANDMTGFDSRKLNEYIGKQITKPVLDSQTLLENLTLLKLTSELQFKPPYIEKIESYVTAKLIEPVQYQYINERPHYLITYMRSYRMRRKVSQTQLSLCIQVIDQHFQALSEKGSKQRKMLRQLLFQLEDQCKTEYKNERIKLIELIQRDPTLTEDDIEAQKLELETDEQVMENVQKFFS